MFKTHLHAFSSVYRNLTNIIVLRNASSNKNVTPDVKPILVDKDGPLTLIGINRPDVKNAIDIKTSIELCNAITEFENDENSTVGVLYGVGGSFCSGHNMNELLDEKVSKELLIRQEDNVSPPRRNIKKPMVCALNGYCVATGLELALLCDLRVMEDSAVLGFLNRRFGIPIIDGGTVRLPAMIGLSRALDLVLTGRSVAAKEAFEIGLANRIVATGTALGQSVNLAQCLAKFPQAALHHDRNSIYNSVYGSKLFDAAIKYEILSTNEAIRNEASKGAAKFKEGIGRGGKSYNIKDRAIPEWEQDEIIREEALKIKS